MKKSISLLASLIAFTLGSSTTGFAFKAPERAPLPQFDKRAGVTRELPDDKKAIVDDIKRRVPNAVVRVDKVFGSPDFISSHSHFLSGPKGQGGAISATQAKLIPAGDAHGPIKAFLNEHSALFGYNSDILVAAQLKREFVTPHSGMRTVIWEQRLDEIPVFDSILMGHITKDGELVNLTTRFVPDLKKAAEAGGQNRNTLRKEPSVSAAAAIVSAAQSLNHSLALDQVSASDDEQGPQRKRHFRAAAALKGEIDTRLTWIPMDAQTLRLAWQVILTSKERGEMFLCVVDATTGEVIVQRCLTNYLSNATYNVFTSDSPSPFSPGFSTPNTAQPAVVPRTSVTFGALNTTASPNGWINDADNETLGNNVDAHTDADDDDQPDLPRPHGNPNRVFDFPLDFTKNPTNSSEAAVVQLFYWDNFMHDKLYELGFTEAAGNFQQDNFGRGGADSDPVRADAQDGGGFDNANMSTPPDGSPARMQMYLFSGATPFRDGDLDAEVICHEYTHGLSNRRVGGGVGIYQLQTAGMGEGWSDFYAMSLLSESSDNPDGNYAQGGYVCYNLIGVSYANYYFGIRRYPYTTDMLKNPLTFKDIDPRQASSHPGIPRNPVPIFGPANEVHNQGEVWCATLWEVRVALVKKYGFAVGNNLAMKLVADGMTLSPVNPNFLEARNAIINADKVDNAGANYALLWTAFAKRGMGGSATSPSSTTTVGLVQAFDIPGLAEVSVQSDDSLTGNANGTVDPNECNYIYVSIQNGGTNTATAISGTLSSSTPGVTVEQATSAYPNIGPGGVAKNTTPFRIYTSSAFACGTPVVFSFVIDATAQHRTNDFSLKTGFVSITPAYYNSSTAVAIPDANSTGVTSSMVISNFSSTVGKATVSLYLTHTRDFDVTVQLIAPDGTKVGLVRNAPTFEQNFGTNCSPQSSRIIFDDGAPTDILGGTAPFVGTFRPADPLQNVSGQSGNGTWQLQVTDSYGGETGTLECWTLALYPTLCSDGGGACGSDVRLTASGPATAAVGSNLVYNLSITNTRPLSAVGVTLTNILPFGFNFVSAVSSQGACVFTNGVIVGNLGNLSTNTINVAITVTATVSGAVTNIFSIGAANDSNPINNVASVTTVVAQASPVIVAAGAQVTSESYAPANGGIESGETVTVNLSLKNTGTSGTLNLIGNLVAGAGVGSPSVAQTYGALAPGGAPVSRPFTFTANAVSGSTIVATLQLQDGANNLGSVNFSFGVGGSGTYQDSSAITINDGGAGSPYPATINVSGLTGVVSKVTVSLSKLTHTFPDDIDVLLVGPAGQKVLLMSDVGGQIGVTNQTLTFSSAFTNTVPDNGPILTGSFAPSDYEAGDVFVSPAPSGPYSSSLDIFKATNPNGGWSLYVLDDNLQDVGVINGGWSISLETVVPVNTNADISVSLSASANPAVIAANLTYTNIISNLGHDTATGVMVTNTIPAGATYVSAASTQGSCSYSAGKVVCNVGILPAGATAVVTVTVLPVGGTLVSSLQAGANELDLNSLNNSASLTTATRSAQADLLVKGFISAASVLVNSNLSYTLSVTNFGPDAALNVVLSNTFSGAVSYVSGTNSQGTITNVGSAVVANLGNLAGGANALVTIVVAPVTLGNLTNRVTVTSATDTNTANNATNLVVAVVAPSPTLVASGSAVLSESFAPADNALEPGESVTINFAIRNIGSGATTNLTATLLSTGGVSAPSGSVSYGVLLPGGASVSRSFSFTANGPNNGTITATLALQDGSQSLGNISFTYTLSTVQNFANSSIIIIPAQGAASTYPATISVAGVTGSVSKVSVTLSNLSHAFPEDIDILLVSPTGKKVLLMSDAGGGVSISNVTLKFDDSGAVLPQSSKILSGTYAPTDYSPAEAFPVSAPAAPYDGSLSVLNGANPNGDWSLYIMDDSGGDAGRIDGGWGLSFIIATPVANNVDLSLGASATPSSLRTGSNATYTINIVNSGPGAATNVVVADLLPANFNIISNVLSQGSVSAVGNTLNYNLGSLAIGGSASITLVASPTAVGSFTNLFSVSAAQSDVNLANNSQSLVTVVVAVPPSFGSAVIGTNRNFEFSFTGQVGYSYVIEGSTNLSNWVPISTNTIVNGGTLQFVDVNTPTNHYRFYRAHVQ